MRITEQEFVRRSVQREMASDNYYQYLYSVCGWEKKILKRCKSWHESNNKIKSSIVIKIAKFFLGERLSITAIAPAGTARNCKLV